MGKWLASAAYALALAGLAVPNTADAQIWKKIKDAAKQQVDSALNTATGGVAGGVRRGSCPTNNTFQCAGGATLGNPIDGAIGGNGRELFYRLTVDQPGVLQFALNPMPNQSAIRLTVADAQYKDIGVFQFEEGQPGTRLFQLAAPGTYYLRLYSWGGEAERFALSVTNSARSPMTSATTANTGCTLNNTFQCSDGVTVGERTTGAVGGNARELYYRIAVDRPSVLQFALSPMPNRSAIRLTVADAEYRDVEAFQFEEGQPGTRLLRIATPGTYYVKLYSWGGEAERFALGITRQP